MIPTINNFKSCCHESATAPHDKISLSCRPSITLGFLLLADDFLLLADAFVMLGDLVMLGELVMLGDLVMLAGLSVSVEFLLVAVARCARCARCLLAALDFAGVEAVVDDEIIVLVVEFAFAFESVGTAVKGNPIASFEADIFNPSLVLLPDKLASFLSQSQPIVSMLHTVVS